MKEGIKFGIGTTLGTFIACVALGALKEVFSPSPNDNDDDTSNKTEES